ncbi:hypothetical protein ACP6PL_20115 [Dapis sp. BLCC M126]
MTLKKYNVGKQIIKVNKYNAGNLTAEKNACNQLFELPIIAP